MSNEHSGVEWYVQCQTCLLCSMEKMLSKQQTYESFNFAHIFRAWLHHITIRIRCSAAIHYAIAMYDSNGRSQDYNKLTYNTRNWGANGSEEAQKGGGKISSSASQRREYGRAFSRVYSIIFQQIFCRVQQTSVIVLLQQISAVVPSLSVNVTNVLLSFHVPYESAELAAICW